MASGADGIILDLEDAVAPAAKDDARLAVSAFLETPSAGFRIVRVNPAQTGRLALDLAAATRADAIMLPKCEGLDDVHAAFAHMPPHQRLLPICLETPRAIFSLGDYGAVASRLAGLTWGAEDLRAEFGASESRKPDGTWTAPFELARNMVLFGAHAAGVDAIETVYPDIRDDAGLRVFADRAAAHGFTGMLALHPGQVAIINAAFMPTAQAIEEARAVLAAQRNAGNQGVTTLDGKMIDAAHLNHARRVLRRAGFDETDCAR